MERIREIALRFLRGSINGGAMPGQVLGPDKFMGPVKLRGQLADFPKALEYAVEQGWLEKVSDQQYRLTVPGHAAGQISD